MNRGVSVVMVTYNHAQFIEQAVLGVLNQECDFPLELILADDNSPDNTSEIIKNIQATHPKGNIVKYTRNSRNLGIMGNATTALSKVENEYLAICEGDDYWSDPFKLQKQVDFLAANQDYSICFHNTKVEQFKDPSQFYLLNEGIKRDVFSLSDLIGTDEIWFMATASLVFKTSAILPVPSWIKDSKSGDIPMIMLAARKGKIKYLPDVMAAYRKHPGGTSLTDEKDDVYFLKNRIFMYKHLNKETGYKYYGRFRRNLARYNFLLIYAKQNRDKYLNRLWQSVIYIFRTFPNVPGLKELIKDGLTPPFLLNLSRKIKRTLGLIPK